MGIFMVYGNRSFIAGKKFCSGTLAVKLIKQMQSKIQFSIILVRN